MLITYKLKIVVFLLFFRIMLNGTEFVHTKFHFNMDLVSPIPILSVSKKKIASLT